MKEFLVEVFVVVKFSCMVFILMFPMLLVFRKTHLTKIKKIVSFMVYVNTFLMIFNLVYFELPLNVEYYAPNGERMLNNVQYEACKMLHGDEMITVYI